MWPSSKKRDVCQLGRAPPPHLPIWSSTLIITTIVIKVTYPLLQSLETTPALSLSIRGGEGGYSPLPPQEPPRRRDLPSPFDVSQGTAGNFYSQRILTPKDSWKGLPRALLTPTPPPLTEPFQWIPDSPCYHRTMWRGVLRSGSATFLSKLTGGGS